MKLNKRKFFKWWNFGLTKRKKHLNSLSCVCSFKEMNETSTEEIWRLDFSIHAHYTFYTLYIHMYIYISNKRRRNNNHMRITIEQSASCVSTKQSNACSNCILYDMWYMSLTFLKRACLLCSIQIDLTIR